MMIIVITILITILLRTIVNKKCQKSVKKCPSPIKQYKESKKNEDIQLKPLSL